MVEKNCLNYEFDLGCKAKRIMSKIIDLLFCLSFDFCVPGFAFVLSAIINSGIENKLVSRIIIYFMFISSILISVFVTVITFLHKKVILTENAVFIKRYGFNFWQIRKGFNDYILYSMISYCKLVDSSCIHNKTLQFSFVNWDSMVEIKDIYGKVYFVPIKNAEDFINKVEERVNRYRRDNGLEEI